MNVFALLFLATSLVCFSAAAESQIVELNQALASKSQRLGYSDSPEDQASFTLVKSAEAKRLYTAVRVDTVGKLGAMACKDSSLFSLIKRFAWHDDRVEVLRVALTINNQKLPALPLALISDVNGDCKVQLLMGRNLTPYVRIESDYHIVVEYEVDYVDTKEVTLLDTIAPIADTALNVFGSQSKFLSKITSDVAKTKLEQLDKYITNQLSTKSEDKITTDFDFQKHKGIYVKLSDDTTQLGFSLSVVPRLSVYVANPANLPQNSEHYLPLYGDNITTILKQQIQPSGVPDVYQTIDEHLIKDDLASQRFKALSDPDPKKFSVACSDMVTELYSRIGQNEYDTAASLYAVLQHTPHHGGGALLDKGCPDNGWIGIMRRLGFGFTDLSQRESLAERAKLITAGNTVLGRISTAVQSKSQSVSSQIAKFTLDSGLVYLSSISGVGDGSDVNRFVNDLWSLSPGYFNCFVAKEADKSANVRSGILIGNVGSGSQKRYGVDVSFRNLNTEDPKVGRISVFELDPNNQDSSDLVDSVRKNGPSSSCQRILSRYMADF